MNRCPAPAVAGSRLVLALARARHRADRTPQQRSAQAAGELPVRVERADREAACIHWLAVPFANRRRASFFCCYQSPGTKRRRPVFSCAVVGLKGPSVKILVSHWMHHLLVESVNKRQCISLQPTGPSEQVVDPEHQEVRGTRKP